MAYLIAALLLGSLVYCILVIIAVGKYCFVRPSVPISLPPISILKPLEGIGNSLEKIAYGVRAIETETSPLSGCIDGINNSLAPVVGGFEAVGSSLTSADQNLGKVAGVLGIK